MKQHTSGNCLWLRKPEIGIAGGSWPGFRGKDRVGACRIAIMDAVGEVAGDVGARLKPAIVERRRPEPAGKGGPELQDALETHLRSGLDQQGVLRAMFKL